MGIFSRSGDRDGQFSSCELFWDARQFLGRAVDLLVVLLLL